MPTCNLFKAAYNASLGELSEQKDSKLNLTSFVKYKQHK